MEKQYTLSENELEIRVKKAPVVARSMMFIFAAISFLLPTVGTILGLASGKGFHIGYAIGLVVFGLLGFYLLRVSLWNSFGKELITFNSNKISYVADYGWFKDGKKEKELVKPIDWGIRPLGYEDEQKGALIIGLDEPIFCASKMPTAELDELITKLVEMDFFEKLNKKEV